MPKKIFVYERHEDFGEMGWRPSDVPKADPLGAMTVAHDCIEHFPNDNGGVECELMALGAAVWIRGCGYFTSPAENNIGSDIPRLMGCVRFSDFSLSNPGRTTESEEDETFNAAIAYAEKEISYMDDELEMSDMEKKFILGWLRKGYRKAQRRFPNRLAACDLFMDIERSVTEFAKDEFVQEGDEIYVSWAKNGTVRVDFESRVW